ncbi:MAG: hypothetical protein ACREMG_00340 [Gemmatimonadales bacterium]
MRSQLAELTPGETTVDVVSEVSVTGILAQLGRGMIQDVSDQLFQRFTAAIRAELETKEEPGEAAKPAAASANEPIQAVSFGAQVAGRTARRWGRSPGFWVAVAAVAALFFWLLLR